MRRALPWLAFAATFALAYLARPRLRGAPIAWLCGSPTTGQPGALPALAAVVQLAALIRWGASRGTKDSGPRSPLSPKRRQDPGAVLLQAGAEAVRGQSLPPRPAPVTPSVACALILAGSAVADGVIRLVPLDWARQMRINAVAWGCIVGVQAWALWKARKARNAI